MRHSRISVTIPKDILREIKEISAIRKTKLSHLVAEALNEKIRKIKEDAFILRINEIFDDPEVAAEQRKMADDIAENINVMELPW